MNFDSRVLFLVAVLGSLGTSVQIVSAQERSNTLSFPCSADIQSSADCAKFVKTKILADKISSGCGFSSVSMNCGGSPGKGFATRFSCSYRAFNKLAPFAPAIDSNFTCGGDVKTADDCRAVIKNNSASTDLVDVLSMNCHPMDVEVSATIYSCSVSTPNCKPASVDPKVGTDDAAYYDKRFTCPANTDKFVMTRDGDSINFTKHVPRPVPSPGNEVAVFCETQTNTAPQPQPQDKPAQADSVN